MSRTSGSSNRPLERPVKTLPRAICLLTFVASRPTYLRDGPSTAGTITPLRATAAATAHATWITAIPTMQVLRRTPVGALLVATCEARRVIGGRTRSVIGLTSLLFPIRGYAPPLGERSIGCPALMPREASRP